jgi:hypothetical protein
VEEKQGEAAPTGRKQSTYGGVVPAVALGGDEKGLRFGSSRARGRWQDRGMEQGKTIFPN